MRSSSASKCFLFLLTNILMMLFVAIPVSGQTQEDWKNDLGTFRIGVVGGKNPAKVISSLEPFRLAVEEELKLPVSILPSPDLRTLLQRHTSGRNEYAILSASAYAAGWASCECIEPLVVATSSDGASGVVSSIIVRDGSDVFRPRDLIGKKIMALGENSTVGYSFPVFQLQKQGIDLMAGATELVFAPTAEEALRRFAEGEGDALFGWSSAVEETGDEVVRGSTYRLAALLPGGKEDIRVIWTSESVPHRVHSIRKNLPSEPKKLLQNLMVRLFEDDPIAYDAVEPEFGSGFKAISQESFKPLVDFVSDAVPKKLDTASETKESEDQ